jgi:hypothetical protein
MPEYAFTRSPPRAASEHEGRSSLVGRAPARRYHGGTQAFADSCILERADRSVERWLQRAQSVSYFGFRPRAPAWLTVWLARLIISAAPLLTVFLWAFVAPSWESLVWTAMYMAILAFAIWSTRDSFDKLDRVEGEIDSLVAPDTMEHLLAPPEEWRSPVPLLLGLSAVPAAFACAVDWLWRGEPADPTWYATVAWTTFWCLTSFWGTRGGIRGIAQNLHDRPRLNLIRHAPSRTPGLEQLRAMVARLWKRSALIIAVLTAPLCWGPFLAMQKHHALTYALLAVDTVTLIFLGAWLARGAYPADRNLVAIAASAKAQLLAELNRELPKTAADLMKPAGQRAINLYDQIAHESPQVDRRSRWFGILATLAPTIIGIGKALSSAVHLHL